MESQPQNPESRINPENFHPWAFPDHTYFSVLAELPFQNHYT